MAKLRGNDFARDFNEPSPVTGPESRGAPAVVMISGQSGEAFEQLSCTLRRRGLRVVMVGTRPEGRTSALGRLTRKLRTRWVYDARIDASELGPDGSLPARLGGLRILDVQADENALAAEGLEPSAVMALAARGLAYARLPPKRLLDKFEVGKILDQAGIRVPPQLRATEMSPADAARALGLPLVVKARTGAGGGGVRIAASIGEILRAVQELSVHDSAGVFYQKHIKGQEMMYGVVAGPDGPLMEHGLSVEATRSPLGPSAVVQVCDDPALLAAGWSVARTIGCLGLADLDFIRDDRGELWHVDANCRCWGNMISLLSAGIDFPEAYVELLLDRRSGLRPTRAPEPGGRDVPVLPFMLHEAASRGPARRIVSLAAQFATLCRRGPGLGYAAIIFVRAGKLLMRRGSRAVRGRAA